MAEFKYASINQAPIYESVVNGKGKKIINKILMGTYVTILEKDGDWYRVATAGPDGWIHAGNLSDEMGLKIFFLDVGQEDGILLEAGKYKVLIDSGPNNNMYGYLTKWQYTYILGAKQKIHIDYLIISHFDVDHYKGATKILNDSRFTFGTIIHPGILKMATKENPYNSGIGSTIKQDGKTYLSLVFDNLLKISQPVTFNRDITAFLKALLKANDEGRVSKVKRYEQGSKIIQKKIEKKTFRF